MRQILHSGGPDQTIKIGQSLGAKLRGGELIDLVGDLGSGKTTLVKGLSLGIGYKGDVTSPTFTLHNQYQGNKLRLDHLDFYRLSEPGLMRRQLAEIVDEPSSIVVIEWSQIVADVLPNGRLSINLSAPSEVERELRFEYPSSLEYLVKGFKC